MFVSPFIRRPSLAAFALLSAALCAAQDKTERLNQAPPAVAKAAGSSNAALSALQGAHEIDGSTFVDQDDLDPLIPESGGGACASAAGIDAMQTLRVMAGLEKLANPHRSLLAAFANEPDLLKGRVPNDRFVRLLKFYQSYLDGATLAVEVESAANSKHTDDHRGWTTSEGPNLALAPWRLKILSYTVIKQTGDVVGRHFVLLKDYADNHIVVVDPHRPTVDRLYRLERRAGADTSCKRVFLLNPRNKPRREHLEYELNTVFTASILNYARVNRHASAAGTTADAVKQQIDRTAAKLRGTRDYLNPRAWRSETAAIGLPGLDLPTEYGGSNWPATKMIDIFRHAGKHNLNFRDIVGGAHVRALLDSNGPEVSEIIRQVAAGRAYIAIAITEPEAGSDVPAIKATARKVEGGYVLSGVKRFNARLDQATHVIVFTQSTSGERGKLSVFVLPIGTPGIKIEHLSAHGLTGNSYGGLTLDDVFVPDVRLIGKDGEGRNLFRKHFLYWRLMQAVAAIGTAEDALDQMAERIKTREAFGAPIGRFTHLQQPIGQHKTELRMAYSLAREAAALIDDDNYHEARPLINGLKAEGVEISLRAVDAATRAFGGLGYSHLVDLGDRLRDLNGLRIADGTTDVMRMEVVRGTYGEVFWNMAVENAREGR